MMEVTRENYTTHSFPSRFTDNHQGYGIATYPSIKVTPSTNFYAGSTTKAFTASALSLLIDNSSSYSSIQWSTPISHLIRDDFVLENEYATTHTTIEDALSHRSGMPRHDFSYGGNYPDEGGIGMGVHKGTIRDAVRALRWLPLTAEPRVSFQYCNMMFVVVSHVVETLTGAWLGDFLKERIWGPLGMHGTVSSSFANLVGSWILVFLGVGF
jgi:CubicO group peptidase (beta-lactamase class C family)